MFNRNRKPALTHDQTAPKFASTCKIALITLSLSLSGCAFFDQPLADQGPITHGAPPSSITPPRLPDSSDTNPTAQPPRLPTSGNQSTVQQSPPALTPPNGATNTSDVLPTLPSRHAYFTIASLIDIPENATNLAFVHFTQLGDSKRALAVCQATMNNLTFVPVENIPNGANTILIWPVSNSGIGNSCLEMIANYEALDISNATAERVNDATKGPFLLTRNASQSKRLIYDLSFVDRSKFARAIDEWRSLLGSDPANWPEYRSAR